MQRCVSVHGLLMDRSLPQGVKHLLHRVSWDRLDMSQQR